MSSTSSSRSRADLETSTSGTSASAFSGSIGSSRRPSSTTSTTAYVEGTRSGDGDHTDALLLIDEPTFPGCRVWARPIGGLEMRDEKGFDFKVLCVAVADPHQGHVERLEQVRPHRLVEIEHFFQTYKLLEDKATEVLGWRDADRAREILLTDRATWDEEHAADGTSAG